MRTLCAIALLAVSFGRVVPAAAQEPAAPEPSLAPAAADPLPGAAAPTAAEPMPAAAESAAEPEAHASPETPPASAPVCVLGEASGVKESDASTAAALVCEALHEDGVDIEPEVLSHAEGRTSYRVTLRSLGSLVLLQVSKHDAAGATLRSEQAQLRSIEEVPVAALRLSDAFAHNRPLQANAKVDTLVGQETRQYGKRHSESLFSFGVLGYGIANTDALGGYGAFMRLMFESPRFSVGGEARIGGSPSEAGDSSLLGFSVGGRYFLSESDTALFVGGGVGALWLTSYDNDYTVVQTQFGESSYRERTSGAGFAPYAEVGVELLRTYKARLDLLLRVDVPVYALQATNGGEDRYALPISLMGSVSFD